MEQQAEERLLTAEEMPRWRCHKVVQALLIFTVERGHDGGGLLYPHDARFAPIATTAAWMTKHDPQPAAPGQPVRGYFVRYEDGYESWSPVEAFEAGYTLI